MMAATMEKDRLAVRQASGRSNVYTDRQINLSSHLKVVVEHGRTGAVSAQWHHPPPRRPYTRIPW